MQVRFVKDKSETTWGVVLPDGRIISMVDEAGRWLEFRYGTTFNLLTGEILPDAEPDGKQLVTLNLLARQQGSPLREVRCYNEHEVRLKFPRTLSDRTVDRIIKEFLENGFVVTKEAILRQFACWKSGFKAGYRDERNNCHLFTPCGANPFALRASELCPLCSSWQTTYSC